MERGEHLQVQPDNERFLIDISPVIETAELTLLEQQLHRSIERLSVCVGVRT